MAILQVRDIEDSLYSELQALVKKEKRSLSQEVIQILENYISGKNRIGINPTEKFLELAGSWIDDRSSAEILSDIKKDRANSQRFGDDNALFD